MEGEMIARPGLEWRDVDLEGKKITLREWALLNIYPWSIMAWPELLFVINIGSQNHFLLFFGITPWLSYFKPTWADTLSSCGLAVEF